MLFKTRRGSILVHVNGSTRLVSKRATLQKLIDAGYARPRPGNLLSVDGQVLEHGAGTSFCATINENWVNDPNKPIPRGATVIIGNGADVVELAQEQMSVLSFVKSSVEPTLEAYFEGAFHLLSAGVDGVAAELTGSISGKTVRKVLKPAIDGGYVVGNANVGNEKLVALTFDDGPHPQNTRRILRVLEKNGVHATFFIVGMHARKYPEILRSIKKAGNQIALHTYDHAAGDGEGRDLALMSPGQQIEEVLKGLEAVNEALGKKVAPIFRAPGGNYYGELVETLAPHIQIEVGWNVDTEDWKKQEPSVIAERIMSAQPGDVILCHDGGGDRSRTIEAIKIAIPQMLDRGFRFVTIDELLSYGIKPVRVDCA